MENFSEVNCCPASALPDLFTATEAVRDDECFLCGASNGRQQDSLTDGLRDIELVTFKSEWSRHSAAAGIWTLQYRSRAAEQGLFVAHLHQRFVMTMTVQENPC